MPHIAEEILEFWFNEAGPSKWFVQHYEFDEEIRSRFENINQEGRRGADPTTRHPA